MIHDDDFVMADCGHWTRLIICKGDRLIPPWCVECEEKMADNLMPLDEAHDFLGQVFTPGKLAAMIEEAKQQRRYQAYRAEPGRN